MTPLPLSKEPNAVEPTPVTISEQQEPVPVIVESVSHAPKAMPRTVTKGEGTTLPPTTTEEQDTVSEGQRIINALWEGTQSRIAQVSVFGGVLVNAVLIVSIIFFGREMSVTQLSVVTICLQFINMTAGIVIGFYFSRTNHSARGGVGERPPDSPYTGR